MTRPYTDDGGGIPDPTGSRAGVVIGERYELAELLGQGGMAEVHRAHDRSLGRVVAVKLLPAGGRHDETDARRLHDEARAAAGLSHPHVVAVHDVGASPYGVYVVMELLGGRTWRDELAERGRVPELEAARVGSAIASALAHAHAHGVVHRDVNPSNVMLLADGTPKLMDFGIAKVEDLGGLTETGKVVGTAAYMSPEQVCGEPLDGRSDVYSLGCTLYEVVTGSPPFRGRGSADVASTRLREPPVPPRQMAPGLSIGLEDVVLRAMALEPANRPDATGLAEALRVVALRADARARPPVPEEAATDVLDTRSTRDPVAADAGPVDTADTSEVPPPSPGLRRLGLALVVLGVLAILVVGVLLLLG